MTPRSSLRARAREIYRQMVEKRAAQFPSASPQTPLIPAQAGIQGDPATPADECPGSPLARGRAERAPTAQNLTEKVRALYEHSAVPVAEIAKLAGVTERTIYKYAAKQQWTPRYRWRAPAAGAGAKRGAHKGKRGWRQRPAFAPVKGAGGRFIRRADKGKPFAAGLKATDAAAAAAANAACRREALASRAAQRRAEAERLVEARLRAHATVNQALADLNGHRAAGAKAGEPRLRDDDRVAQLLVRVVDIATERWRRLLARNL